MRHLLLLYLLLTLFSCQKYTLNGLPQDRLHFGNAGGFTGEIREYILLLDSGRILFDNRTTGALEKIGRLSKEELSVFRAEIDKIDFQRGGNKPGNMTTSMTRYGQGPAASLSWSGPKGAPSSTAGACFEALMQKVRQLRATE